MNDAPSERVLLIDGLRKVFFKGGREIEVLSGLDLAVSRGEMVGILGASGAGKSTLLHIAGGLDAPTAGRVTYGREDIFRLTEPKRAAFRNHEIGFVFQMHYLLSEFSCLENVMLPGIIAGHPGEEVRARAMDLLEVVGLAQRTTHRPGELSGGEQQRAAVARALVNNPTLVLADEPTGNLDTAAAASVQQLFLSLNRRLGVTFLVVTHNREMASRFHRRLVLKRGTLHRED